jgi:drug/metabolite transporter (DMT)-like permease
VSATVLALVIAAAFAHAGWNFLAKGASGGVAFVWLSIAFGSVLWVPVLAFATAADVTWEAIGLMAGSGLLHALYFALLQRGYATGDLSLVYPLARGTGPLLSTTAAVLVLGERPSLLAVAGAALIVGAVLSFVAAPGRARLGEASTFALLTGVAIASYTLWDKYAVDDAELGPLVYNWGTNAFNLLLLSAWVVARRTGGLRMAWERSRWRAVGVGALSPLAYILVLYALQRAPVSYVAPARETSILIGTLLGTTVLSEGDMKRRMIASAGILLGVAALALG